MKTKKLTLMALTMGLVLLLSLTFSSQTLAQAPAHTEGSVEFYTEFILSHQIDTSTSGTTTPSGNIGKSFWYNLSDAQTPFDEFFNGEFLLNETMNLTIFANLENTKMRAIVLNEQNGSEGYMWDVARIFYLGQDIIIRTNLSQSTPTDALDEVIIPAGTPLTQFQPTWEWANWTTFFDIVSNSSDGPGFLIPFEGKTMLSVLPSLLLLDESLWYDNIYILGEVFSAIRNDTMFQGDIYSENATDGITYQLYMQFTENVSDPLSPTMYLTFNWTDMDGTFARLDWMSFNLLGDFDGNGTIDPIEEFYFLWEYIGMDSASTQPYAVGQRGSYVIDSAVLDITPTGDLATYLDENGATPYINSAERQFNELTGTPFMDYLITDVDGLYYGVNVTVYNNLAKTLMNITNPNGVPPDMPDARFFRGIATPYLGLRGFNATIMPRFIFHQNPELPPFSDFERALRANSTGWLLLPADPNIQNVKIFRADDIDPMRPLEDQLDTLPAVTILQQFYGEYVYTDSFNFSYTTYGYLVQIDTNDITYFETFDEGVFTQPLVAYYEFVPRPSYRLYILDNPFFMPMLGVMGPGPGEPMGPGPDEPMGPGPDEPMGPGPMGPNPIDLLLMNMELPYYDPALFDVQANASATANALTSEVEEVFNDVFSSPDIISEITANSSIENISLSLDLTVDHVQTPSSVTTNTSVSLIGDIDIYDDTDPQHVVNGSVMIDVWLNTYVIYDTNGTLLEQGVIVDIYVEWSLDGITFDELISGPAPPPTETTTTTTTTTTTELNATNSTTPPPAESPSGPTVTTPGFETVSLVMAVALSFVAYRMKKRRGTS